MFSKILRSASFTVLSVLLISSILFLGLTSVDALVKGWTPLSEKSFSQETNEDNPLGMVEELSEDNQNKENEKSMDQMTMRDIFGDEQIYPFEQGIGGHGAASAH